MSPFALPRKLLPVALGALLLTLLLAALWRPGDASTAMDHVFQSALQPTATTGAPAGDGRTDRHAAGRPGGAHRDAGGSRAHCCVHPTIAAGVEGLAAHADADRDRDAHAHGDPNGHADTDANQVWLEGRRVSGQSIYRGDAYRR